MPMNESSADIVLALPIYTTVTVVLPRPADAKTYLDRFRITLPLDMAGEHWDHRHDYRRVQAELAVGGAVLAQLVAVQNRLLQMMVPNAPFADQWLAIDAHGNVSIRGDWFQSVIQGEKPLPWPGNLVHPQNKGVTQLEILEINLHSPASLLARWRAAIRNPVFVVAILQLLLQGYPVLCTLGAPRPPSHGLYSY